MTHEEFVAGYCDGRIVAHVDRQGAAKLVSRRMQLPLVLLPFLGLAVALALTGRLVLGIALFLLAVAFRLAVRATSHGFVLSRSLADAGFYEEALAAGVLRLENR